ncbi:unnamed protein product [Closterium sp. Naga37s-1]|nr:unnamed protein product [Closterium sp. Naga37s-1]
MLSGAESAALLSELAEDKSFKSNADAFSRAFPPARRFTACCALAMLLEVASEASLPAIERCFALNLLSHSLADVSPHKSISELT